MGQNPRLCSHYAGDMLAQNGSLSSRRGDSSDRITGYCLLSHVLEAFDQKQLTRTGSPTLDLSSPGVRNHPVANSREGPVPSQPVVSFASIASLKACDVNSVCLSVQASFP
jgi:hypothetical protein